MRVFIFSMLLVAGCDVFRDDGDSPKTALSQSEFVDVYVALANASTPAEKKRVLQQHKTSEKQLQDFVNAYSRDLPALSATFDSIVTRLGASGETRIPVLPGR